MIRPQFWDITSFYIDNKEGFYLILLKYANAW